MTDVRQMKATVQAAVKKADAGVMAGTFYDAASDRMFVTIVKGSRKISVALRGRDFGNGGSDTVIRAITEGIQRLDRTPIG